MTMSEPSVVAQHAENRRVEQLRRLNRSISLAELELADMRAKRDELLSGLDDSFLRSLGIVPATWSPADSLDQETARDTSSPASCPELLAPERWDGLS